MTSLKDVINLQKRQQSRYNQLREDMINKLSEKIKHLAKHGELRCVYSVPNYTFGYPKYNVEEITTYIYVYLKNQGFCAVLLGNDKIFISWDIKDINNYNQYKKKKNKLIDIKPLINKSK